MSIMVPGWAEQKHDTLSEKQTKEQRKAGAQVVKCRPTKRKDLSSNSSTTKKN
jgi:hypothetical protein